MAQKIQIRRGTAEQGRQTTLDSGEPGFDTDEPLLRIGDGSTAGGKLFPPVDAAAQYSAPAAFSAAGDTLLEVARPFARLSSKLTAQAGSGAYTRTISLATVLADGATEITPGAQLEALLDTAESGNPTVEFRDAASDGTLLVPVQWASGAPRYWRGLFVYTGSAWEFWGGIWLP